MLQPIECSAAVAWEAKKPLSLETVTVDPPQKGEVRIKVTALAIVLDDQAGQTDGLGSLMVHLVVVCSKPPLPLHLTGD